MQIVHFILRAITICKGGETAKKISPIRVGVVNLISNALITLPLCPINRVKIVIHHAMPGLPPSRTFFSALTSLERWNDKFLLLLFGSQACHPVNYVRNIYFEIRFLIVIYGQARCYKWVECLCIKLQCQVPRNWKFKTRIDFCRKHSSVTKHFSTCAMNLLSWQ